MSVFIYKAKKGPDDIIEGTMNADSVDTVVETLNNQGYIPFVVEEGEGGGGSESKISKNKKVVKKTTKVKRKDINIFIRQLSNLLRSKVTLIKAINIIHDQTENVTFKEIIQEIIDHVREGGRISDVFENYPQYFSAMHINTTRSGEIGCVLEESLIRLAEFADKEEEFRTKMRVAIAYPIFMMLTGIGTIIVLLTFVMPKLTGMFVDMGQALPVPTQIVMGLSNGMRKYWSIMVGVIAAVSLLFKKRGLTDNEKYAFDKIKLSIPVFGKFLKEAEVSRFSRTASLLLDNGVALYQAIETTIPTLSNLIIKKELKEVAEAVVAGESFSRSLQDTNSFPPFVISMITVGEEGGTLSSALTDVALYYEREGDQAMKIMSSLLEPALILVMGLVIGFMVIAMLLPIFELSTLTG